MARQGTTDAGLCRDLSGGHHASSFNYEFTSAFGGIVLQNPFWGMALEILRAVGATIE
jgi:hypothetical protein